MKTLISLMVISFLMSGCALFKPANEGGIPIEQKEKLVKNGAATVTYFAIKESVKETEKQNDVAAQLIGISNQALAVLVKPEEPLTGILAEKLFNLIPEPYNGLIVALDALQNYYQAPAPNDLLSEDAIRLLKALFTGIKTGAVKVLNSNGVEAVMMPVFTAEALVES